MRAALYWLVLLNVAVLRLQAEVAVTLRTGDVFEMHLGGLPHDIVDEFASQYTVGSDGTINVPVIGEVKAAGLTPSQLERAIQSKLVADKVFTRPTVLINVAQTARSVSISGGVRNPQRLAWSADLTLGSSIGN